MTCKSSTSTICPAFRHANEFAAQPILSKSSNLVWPSTLMVKVCPLRNACSIKLLAPTLRILPVTPSASSNSLPSSSSRRWAVVVVTVTSGEMVKLVWMEEFRLKSRRRLRELVPLIVSGNGAPVMVTED